MTSSNDQIWISMLQRKPSDLPWMTSSDMQTFSEGPVLSFHNICYRVKVKSGFLLGRKTVEKEILSNINGIMKPGLNAIMGPRGGGKSSLLDVLAARKDPHGLSGEVLINGDGVGMGTLTVRENLQFAAALRLIESAKRKRTNIAMELITDPPILFLDEPTAGLDSSTASAILLLLKSISERGRTIIFTIHQPRYSIFKLFDSLTLFASGKLMYYGPAQEALEYFQSAGYQCEPYSNPAYFFLDVINRDSSAIVLNRKEEDSEQFSKRKKPVIDTLAEFYANSSFYRNTEARLQELSDGQKRSSGFKEITHVTSFCHQFRWILWRAFRNYLGFPSVTIPQVTYQIFVLFYTNGIDMTAILLFLFCPGRAWALYVLVVVQCLSSVTSAQQHLIWAVWCVLLFCRHEYLSGYYRVLPYFLGELLSELIPRRLFPTIIFTSILYFMLGLKLDVGAFFMLMIIVLLVAYATGTMAMILGAGEKAMEIKTFLVTVYFVFMMVSVLYLASGNFLKCKTIYLAFPLPLMIKALQHNEFWGQNFCPGLSTTESSGCISYVICTGEEFLTIQDIDLSPWGLWKNLLSLTCMIFIFLTITYLKLVFLKKYS
uniref:ATP-binding cassette sub-family G member 2-like n=1 Tax=Marmota marmota marmota TaxID=9994 RepID=A0A8C6EPL0_MARMA